MFDSISDKIERIATQVLDAAFRVHRSLGPGLLESVYETCLCHEFSKKKSFQRQVQFPVEYDGIQLDTGLRLDLLVEDVVIVELKAVEEMHSLYEAQLLTYLKLTGKRLGFLINFNVPRLKNHLKRLVI